MNKLLLTVLTALSLLTALQLSAQCGFTVTTNITHVSCFNGTTGAISVTASGGTAPYQYQLSVGGAGAWASNNNFTGLAAGTYPVSVRDGAGCVSTSYVTLTQPTQLTVSYSAVDPTCNGSNNGSITINPSGGTAPYTYSWTRDGSAFATTANISSLSPGNYQLVVTDAANCSTSPVISSQVRPVTLTGFNEDVIAEGTSIAATSVSTQSIDDARGNGWGNLFYAASYSNSSGTGTKGLPSSRSFASAQDAARNYTLAAYNGSNALLLRSSTDNAYGGSTSGTLSFADVHRSPYATLYVVGTTGSGTGSISYTVTFADATTQTGSLSFQDWYLTPGSASSQRALGNIGRVSRQNPGTLDNTGNFNLWEVPIAISGGNQSKVLNSITFSWSGSGTARTAIFAVTGYTSTTSGIRINQGPSSSVSPSVSIATTTGSSQFCSGESVTFTATPVNGGTSPSYQWRRNGSNVGTNSSSYTINSLANNDQISVVLTAAGSVGCLSTTTSTSNTITMTQVTKNASVAIAASSSSICSGTTVNFTATPTHGGGSPTYQWRLNGTNVGTNSTSYSNANLAHNDQVSAVMTSSIGCATNNPATSNTITMSVTARATPSVTIGSTRSGSFVNFSSSASGAGNSPTYQWFRNGASISGATAATYSVNNPVMNDQYAVRVTSNHSCPAAPMAMSNYITITPTVLPVVLDWYRIRVVDRKRVLLEWKTSYEQQSKQFIIERRSNADFTVIGTVAAANQLNGSSYSFTDEPAPGRYFYRLMEEDLAGAKKFLGVLSADLHSNSSWLVRDLGRSWLIQSATALQYELIDVNGRLLEQGRVTGEKRITKPAPGSYYLLKIIVAGQTTTTKLF